MYSSSRQGQPAKKQNQDVMFKPTQHMFSAEINNYFNTEGDNPDASRSAKGKRSASKTSFSSRRERELFHERKKKRPTQSRGPKPVSLEAGSVQEEDSLDDETPPTIEVTEHSRSLAQLQGAQHAKIGEFFHNLSVQVRFKSSCLINMLSPRQPRKSLETQAKTSTESRTSRS